MEKSISLTENEANEIAVALLYSANVPLELIEKPGNKLSKFDITLIKIDYSAIEKILQIFPSIKQDPAFDLKILQMLKKIATIKNPEDEDILDFANKPNKIETNLSVDELTNLGYDYINNLLTQDEEVDSLFAKSQNKERFLYNSLNEFWRKEFTNLSHNPLFALKLEEATKRITETQTSKHLPHRSIDELIALGFEYITKLLDKNEEARNLLLKSQRQENFLHNSLNEFWRKEFTNLSHNPLFALKLEEATKRIAEKWIETQTDKIDSETQTDKIDSNLSVDELADLGLDYINNLMDQNEEFGKILSRDSDENQFFRVENLLNSSLRPFWRKISGDIYDPIRSIKIREAERTIWHRWIKLQLTKQLSEKELAKLEEFDNKKCDELVNEIGSYAMSDPSLFSHISGARQKIISNFLAEKYCMKNRFINGYKWGPFGEKLRELSNLALEHFDNVEIQSKKDLLESFQEWSIQTVEYPLSLNDVYSFLAFKGLEMTPTRFKKELFIRIKTKYGNLFRGTKTKYDN